MEDKKTELFNCGKELSAVKGFKDTNVAGITKMAGVAVGTFYKYYPSKEKLFMEIFLDENVKLKKKMMELVNTDDPIKFVKEMMRFNLDGIKSNPILCQWYNPDVFEKIERLFREENGIDAVEFLYGDSIKLVMSWQAEGKMRKDIDCGLIMAIFGAIINIDTHKNEIGLQYFPQVMDHITDFVMKGLTDSPK